MSAHWLMPSRMCLFTSAICAFLSSLSLFSASNDFHLSMPLYKQIIGVLLIFALFYATPYIVRFVLAHFKNHPQALLICGRIIAIIAGSSAAIFIYLKSGFSIHYGKWEISISQGWSFWSAFVITWIFILLYQISRNRRHITTNHRFLYNTVALYLLSLIIYIGYIRDAIHII